MVNEGVYFMFFTGPVTNSCPLVVHYSSGSRMARQSLSDDECEGQAWISMDRFVLERDKCLRPDNLSKTNYSASYPAVTSSFAPPSSFVSPAMDSIAITAFSLFSIHLQLHCQFFALEGITRVVTCAYFLFKYFC